METVKKYDIEEIREAMTELLEAMYAEEEKSDALEEAIVAKCGIDNADVYIPPIQYGLLDAILKMWSVFIEQDVDSHFGSDLEWFMYECDWGKKGYGIKGHNDKELHDINNIGDFVDYIIHNYFEADESVDEIEGTDTEAEETEETCSQAQDKEQIMKELFGNEYINATQGQFDEFSKTLSDCIKYLGDAYTNKTTRV